MADITVTMPTWDVAWAWMCANWWVYLCIHVFYFIVTQWHSLYQSRKYNMTLKDDPYCYEHVTVNDQLIAGLGRLMLGLPFHIIKIPINIIYFIFIQKTAVPWIEWHEPPAIISQFSNGYQCKNGSWCRTPI